VVGFAFNSERIAALQRTDVEGNLRVEDI
jgi:hypothetical protein